MKKEQYLELLKRSTLSSGMGLLGYGFVFQQDNDPQHTTRIFKQYLEDQQQTVIPQIRGL